jgi:hypothetical protein
MDMDTFMTTVYVMADDYCKAHTIDWPVLPGPHAECGRSADVEPAEPLGALW